MARVALVADGSSKLGAAICLKLATLGYQALAFYLRDNADTNTWLADMELSAHNFRAYRCDIGNRRAVRRCLIAIENEIGPIDIVIDNSPLALAGFYKRMNTSDRDASARSASNSGDGLVKFVCAGMIERGWGRVINIPAQNEEVASSDCRSGRIDLHDWTKALALEFARHGITVNTISPVCSEALMVMPEQVPEKMREMRTTSSASVDYLNQAEEIASLVAYMASDEAAFLSGTCIVVRSGLRVS